jgi:hypothetical protein
MADFTREEIDVIYRVMTARRDMRHFLNDPLDEALVDYWSECAEVEDVASDLTFRDPRRGGGEKPG